MSETISSPINCTDCFHYRRSSAKGFTLSHHGAQLFVTSEKPLDDARARYLQDNKADILGWLHENRPPADFGRVGVEVPATPAEEKIRAAVESLVNEALDWYEGDLEAIAQEEDEAGIVNMILDYLSKRDWYRGHKSNNISSETPTA